METEVGRAQVSAVVQVVIRNPLPEVWLGVFVSGDQLSKSNFAPAGCLVIGSTMEPPRLVSCQKLGMFYQLVQAA